MPSSDCAHHDVTTVDETEIDVRIAVAALSDLRFEIAIVRADRRSFISRSRRTRMVSTGR